MNEERNIEACLSTILNQTYPSDLFEIIVVDGGSSDKTQDIVREIAEESGRVRLVVETKKGTAAGRNAGLKASKHQCAAFIDADCEAPPDWLDILARQYQTITAADPRVVAVGGTNIHPENADAFVTAIGIANDSYLGSFVSAQGRRFRKPVYVKSLANLNVLYDKQKLVDIGYYDESLGSEAEDADINYRIYSGGYRFLFIPESFVWHKLRPTPLKWLKNMFRYGKGRARLLKRHPSMWSFYYIAPLVFSSAVSMTLLFPVSKYFLLPLLYAPLLFCYALFHAVKNKVPHLVWHVMMALALKHFGYGFGEVYGLLSPKVK